MSEKRVLVADAEVEASSRLFQVLKAEGYDVSLAKSVGDVLRNLESTLFDFAISELRFTDGDGIDVIAAMKAASPMCRLVLSSRFCDIATAVCAVKAGASDVVPKPVPVDILIALLLDEPLHAQSNLPRQRHRTARLLHAPLRTSAIRHHRRTARSADGGRIF